MPPGPAAEAATLTAALKPELAIPHHYAFTGGRLGDLLMTKSEKNPVPFADACARLAPGTRVEITQPGTPVTL